MIDEGPVNTLDEPKRVVVAGEFSSGKSSVINLILREPLMLPSVGLKKRPLTRIRYADATLVTAVMTDDRLLEMPDPDAGLRDPHSREVLIATPVSTLPGLEIVELPAPPDGPLDPAWAEMAASADLFIWCTIASQAWRLSEKACVQQLPDDLAARSVLAVTRSDLVRSESDRRKVSARLGSEVEPFFSENVFVSAGGAAMARLHDDAFWNKSGGATLVDLALRVEGAEVTPKTTKDPFGLVASGAGVSAPVAAKSVEAGPLPVPKGEDTSQPGGNVLAPLQALPGFSAACIIETETRRCLAEIGQADFEQIAARSSLFLRLQLIALPAVGGDGAIEDVVISTGKQFQLLRCMQDCPDVHLVVLISRDGGNLARARLSLQAVAVDVARDRSGFRKNTQL